MLKISNILASSSPRRKKLLEKIGLSFSIEESNVVEKLTLDIPPHKVAKHWAREKAKNVSTNNINAIALYEKHCFSLMNIRKNYYLINGNKYDALCYAKKLI